MTRYLERIGRVWDAIAATEQVDLVGFCLDTCHAHAGGNALETVVDDVLKITGRIDLVHCNDSRDEFDSGADRHANLGAGKIDPDLLAAVVRDAGAPVVLETPGGAAEHVADATGSPAAVPSQAALSRDRPGTDEVARRSSDSPDRPVHRAGGPAAAAARRSRSASKTRNRNPCGALLERQQVAGAVDDLPAAQAESAAAEPHREPGARPARSARWPGCGSWTTWTAVDRVGDVVTDMAWLLAVERSP